jgi:hypothetical protein
MRSGKPFCSTCEAREARDQAPERAARSSGAGAGQRAHLKRNLHRRQVRIRPRQAAQVHQDAEHAAGAHGGGDRVHHIHEEALELGDAILAGGAVRARNNHHEGQAVAAEALHADFFLRQLHGHVVRALAPAEGGAPAAVL